MYEEEEVISLQRRDLMFLFFSLMWGNGAASMWMKISGHDCTLGIPKTTPRFQDLLEGLRGLGGHIHEFMTMICYREIIQSNNSKKKRTCGAETRGNQAGASKSPLQSPRGVTQDALNSSSYYLRQYVWNVVYQGRSLDTWDLWFLFRWSCRHFLPCTYRNPDS